MEDDSSSGCGLNPVLASKMMLPPTTTSHENRSRDAPRTDPFRRLEFVPSRPEDDDDDDDDHRRTNSPPPAAALETESTMPPLESVVQRTLKEATNNISSTPCSASVSQEFEFPIEEPESPPPDNAEKEETKNETQNETDTETVTTLTRLQQLKQARHASQERLSWQVQSLVPNQSKPNQPPKQTRRNSNQSNRSITSSSVHSQEASIQEQLNRLKSSLTYSSCSFSENDFSLSSSHDADDSDDENESSKASNSSSSTPPPPHVRFSSIEIRTFNIVLGDTPACAKGAPIALGHEQQSMTMVTVEEFEMTRQPNQPRKLTKATRRLLLLAWNYTPDEIMAAEQRLRRNRFQKKAVRKFRQMTTRRTQSSHDAKEDTYHYDHDESSRLSQSTTTPTIKYTTTTTTSAHSVTASSFSRSKTGGLETDHPNLMVFTNHPERPSWRNMSPLRNLTPPRRRNHNHSTDRGPPNRPPRTTPPKQRPSERGWNHRIPHLHRPPIPPNNCSTTQSSPPRRRRLRRLSLLGGGGGNDNDNHEDIVTNSDHENETTTAPKMPLRRLRRLSLLGGRGVNPDSDDDEIATKNIENEVPTAQPPKMPLRRLRRLSLLGGRGGNPESDDEEPVIKKKNEVPAAQAPKMPRRLRRLSLLGGRGGNPDSDDEETASKNIENEVPAAQPPKMPLRRLRRLSLLGRGNVNDEEPASVDETPASRPPRIPRLKRLSMGMMGRNHNDSSHTGPAEPSSPVQQEASSPAAPPRLHGLRRLSMGLMGAGRSSDGNAASSGLSSSNQAMDNRYNADHGDGGGVRFLRRLSMGIPGNNVRPKNMSLDGATASPVSSNNNIKISEERSGQSREHDRLSRGEDQQEFSRERDTRAPMRPQRSMSPVPGFRNNPDNKTEASPEASPDAYSPNSPETKPRFPSPKKAWRRLSMNKAPRSQRKENGDMNFSRRPRYRSPKLSPKSVWNRVSIPFPLKPPPLSVENSDTKQPKQSDAVKQLDVSRKEGGLSETAVIPIVCNATHGGDKVSMMSDKPSHLKIVPQPDEDASMVSILDDDGNDIFRVDDDDFPVVCKPYPKRAPRGPALPRILSERLTIVSSNDSSYESEENVLLDQDDRSMVNSVDGKHNDHKVGIEAAVDDDEHAAPSKASLENNPNESFQPKVSSENSTITSIRSFGEAISGREWAPLDQEESSTSSLRDDVNDDILAMKKEWDDGDEQNGPEQVPEKQTMVCLSDMPSLVDEDPSMVSILDSNGNDIFRTVGDDESAIVATSFAKRPPRKPAFPRILSERQAMIPLNDSPHQKEKVIVVDHEDPSMVSLLDEDLDEPLSNNEGIASKQLDAAKLQSRKGPTEAMAMTTTSLLKIADDDPSSVTFPDDVGDDGNDGNDTRNDNNDDDTDGDSCESRGYIDMVQLKTTGRQLLQKEPSDPSFVSIDDDASLFSNSDDGKSPVQNTSYLKKQTTTEDDDDADLPPPFHDKFSQLEATPSHLSPSSDKPLLSMNDAPEAVGPGISVI